MKHTKITVLSLSALLALGGIAGAASFFLTKNNNAKVEEKPFEDVAVQDDIGTGIKFLEAADGDASSIKVSTNIGVQTIALDDGSYSLRYVAKLSEYHGLSGASFTRTVTAEGGEVIKASKAIAIDTVYTSLTDPDSVLWAPAGSTVEDTDTTLYPYFAVYTLKNIPSDHLFDTVNVTFSALAGEEIGNATQSANVMGVVGEVSKGVKFAQNDAEKTAGTWHVEKEDSSIAEAVIPEYHFTVAADTYIATCLGKVVAIGDTTSSTGGFESCASLTSVTMPSSIETFNKWCFYNCKTLVELTLPESLTTIMGSAFSNLNSLTTVTYKAKALSSVSARIDKAGLIINIDKGITSLPSDRLFTDDYLPKQINFGGTEAEWATLMSGKTNGLGIDNVICSDTVVSNVTFHIGEGAINIDGSPKTGDYIVKVINGKVLATIGSPSLSGKMFAGWYTAETGGEKYDFTATVTGDMDLYARYEDLPAGKSLDDPFAVSAAPFTANITTIPDMEIYYVKFTVPATDIYYISMANIVLDADTSSATSTSSGHIFAYDSTKTEVTPTTYAIGSTDKIQSVPYSDNGKLIANLVKDDVYYFGFVDYYSTYSPDNHGYGTADISIVTKENDSPDTAIAYTFGATAQVSYVEDDPSKFYGFTAATTGTLALNIVDTGSLYFSAEVYEEGAYGTAITKASGTSSTTKLFAVTAGKKYYIAFSSNSSSTDTQYFSFSVANPPAGSTAADPATNLVVGAALMNVDNVGSYSTFYKVTIATAGTYRFLMSGGSQYTQKFVEIFDSTGATSLGKKASPGRTESSGWGDDETYYDDAYEYDLALAAGDYIVNVGFPSTNTPESIKIQVLLGEPGVNAALAEAVTWSENSLTIAANADGYYSTYTASEAATWSVTVPTGVTLSVTIGSAKAVSIAGDDAAHKITEAAGDKVIIVAISSTLTSVTLTRAAYVGSLTGASCVGKTYMGVRNGGSYYKATFTADGLKWESASSATEATGVTISGDITTMTVGKKVITASSTHMWVVDGTDTYFFSASCTTYNTTAIGGQRVYTYGATPTSGVIIQSVVATATSAREYACSIDGVIHLNCTVEFTTGTDIVTEGNVFVIKDGDTALKTCTVGASKVITVA